MLTSLIAVSICLLLERRKSAEAISEAAFFKSQVGYIEVEDESKAYVRALLCDSTNSWHFRVYLPPDHDYVSVIQLGDPNVPSRFDESVKLPSGQFTIAVDEVVDLMKPNKTPIQAFVVSTIKDFSDKDSLTVSGVRWPESETKRFRTYMGRFDNIAHQTSLRHEENVRVFNSGEAITLFEVAEPKKDVAESSGHVISIKLISKSNADLTSRRRVNDAVKETSR